MKQKAHDPLFDIMIIDDSKDMCLDLTTLLESRGYHVTGSALSASAAGRLTAFLHSKLFIIDIIMPQVNGMELAQMIKKRDSQHFIIMLSHIKLENIIIEAISHGADDILAKPFHHDRLLNSITRIEEKYTLSQ